MASHDFHLQAMPSISSLSDKGIDRVQREDNKSNYHASQSALTVPGDVSAKLEPASPSHQAKERSRLARYYSGTTGRLYPSMVAYKRPIHPNFDDADQPPPFRPDEDKEWEYWDRYGNRVHKKLDVPVYLSKTTYRPRRLLVQCTDQVWKDVKNQGGDWRRVKLAGDVPLVLRISDWALRPADKKGERGHEKRPILGMVHAFGRIILVGPLMQVLMALPGMNAPWEDHTDVDDKYEDFPGYSWDWPAHAINRFDMGGNRMISQSAQFSSKPRQIRPKKLMVYDERTGKFELDIDPHPDIPFVVISFTRAHFHVNEDSRYGTTEAIAAKAREDLEQLAAHVTKQHFEILRLQTTGSHKKSQNQYAYWLDYRCGSSYEDKPEIFAQYVDQICDLVRTASKVIIALPDDPSSEKSNYKKWGDSLWTLSEVLLASGDIQMWWPVKSVSKQPVAIDQTQYQAVGDKEETEYMVRTETKIGMTSKFWKEDAQGEWAEDQQPTRILAEHFSGVLDLSRIELFVTALVAFKSRYDAPNGNYDIGELKSALMAVLRHRVDPGTKDESLFHSLARLNMANDSDDFIERMLCWAPPSTSLDMSSRKASDIFSLYNLALPDQYGSRLWNIQPMCAVVGLAKEDNTIMIDDCRAMSIRWKNFPAQDYKRSEGFKKLFAELVVRSSGLWTVAAINKCITYIPYFITEPSPSLSDDSATANSTTNATSSGDSSDNVDDNELAALLIFVVAIIYVVGLILSFFGPSCVRRLYGGSVTESSSRLVAFEGTLPEEAIERIIYGSFNNRLQWQPSASPLSFADQEKRLGVRPAWFSGTSSVPDQEYINKMRSDLNIPASHKIFTLVDTGRLTITTFTAEHPPSAALLCGRDSGMLRAVLCSWDHKNDCLYKESVIRMSTSVWEGATPKSWLKVCLTSRRPFFEL